MESTSSDNTSDVDSHSSSIEQIESKFFQPYIKK
jgi:hypothetical protein